MSNTNYNLILTCEWEYDGQSGELEFDPYNDCTDMDGLKELVVTDIEENFDKETDEDGDEIDFTVNDDSVKIKITDYDEVPSSYANEKDVWDFAEAFAECEQKIEVVEAALQCGVDPADIDEAYQGEYKDDQDFAQETAESIGAIDKDAKWPMGCIDWEFAARELMYDYSDHNGYYFRNF